jgi:hypothetical protein
MDDELNIDPRETDYFDDYDMEKAMNFFELDKQLQELGFHDPLVTNELRKMVAKDKQLYDIYTKEEGADFTLSFKKGENFEYGLYCIDASMDIPGKVNNQVMQYLQPDVPVNIAIELLKLSLCIRNDHDPFMPLNLKETQEYIHELKLNTMNTENLSYLQKQLLNSGFGEKMNEDLEKQIKSGKKEFTLQTTQEYE